MKGLFQSNAVEQTPAPQLQSKASNQVVKSINEILALSPDVAEFIMTSENEVWSYYRAIDFEGRVIAKYAIKSEGNFTMDTKYRFSVSQRDSNEFLGYAIFEYEVKGTSLFKRERPAPVAEPETVVPTGDAQDAIAQLIEQNRILMEKLSQQPTAPAPKTIRKSTPKVSEDEIPF